LAKRYISTVIMLVALAPIVLISVMVVRYGVGVPFGDDWVMAKIFQSAHHGTLNLADFWQLHNEHRVFFPKLAMFGVALVTGWDIKAQIFLNLSLAITTAAILSIYVHNQLKNKILCASIVLALSAWLFSPVQSENWIWAWQFSWYSSLLAATATLFILNQVKSLERSPWTFLIATMLALIVSFSLGGGLLIWIVGLAVLVMNKSKRNAYIIWSTIGILASTLYYGGYSKPSTSPPTLYILDHKLAALRYFLSLIGRPVTDNQQAAIIVGALFMAALIPITLLLFKRRHQLSRIAAPILALSAYCLGALMLTTVSRVGFGIEQAMASRYTTITVLFFVTVIIAAGLVVDSYRRLKSYESMAEITAITILAINAPLIIFSYAQGIVSLKQRSEYMYAVKTCTHKRVVTKDCANITFPGFGGIVSSNIEYVKGKGWGGY